MASSSVAGLPAMVATGRSSTWWLRNHALPRTQAFLALVMWLPSTVNSMSSQTQPQKVQVALLTIFSSVPPMRVLRSTKPLQFHVDPLAVRHPRPMRIAAHEPARRIAVGKEQQPRRQFARLGRLTRQFHLALFASQAHPV